MVWILLSVKQESTKVKMNVMVITLYGCHGLCCSPEVEIADVRLQSSREA